jgi:curli biogenesis system outer membrane secretion channel CsgG
MLKIKSAFLIFSIILLATLSGCAQKTTIAMLQPAEIDIKAKNIAVLPFKSDKKTGLTGKLESALTNIRFQGKPYFNVVDRTNIENTIKEQKRQSNDLYNENSDVEVGSLMGASALISGRILSISKNDQRHSEDRRKCKKKSCYDYTVS